MTANLVNTYAVAAKFSTGATSGAGTAYPFGAPEFTPVFSFMCMFCKSLFVLLSFFFRPLC